MGMKKADLVRGCKYYVLAAIQSQDSLNFLASPIPSDAKEFRKIEEKIVKKWLDIIVLKAVVSQPMSGYSLLQYIHKKFGVKLSAGTVYSLLRSLEKKGLLQADNQKKRSYTLTEKGVRTLRLIGNMQKKIAASNKNIFELSSLTSSARESSASLSQRKKQLQIVQ